MFDLPPGPSLLNEQSNYTGFGKVPDGVNHNQPELVLTGRDCVGIPCAQYALSNGTIEKRDKTPFRSTRHAKLEFVVIKIVNKSRAGDLNDAFNRSPGTRIGDSRARDGATGRLAAG